MQAQLSHCHTHLRLTQISCCVVIFVAHKVPWFLCSNSRSMGGNEREHNKKGRAWKNKRIRSVGSVMSASAAVCRPFSAGLACNISSKVESKLCLCCGYWATDHAPPLLEPLYKKCDLFLKFLRFLIFVRFFNWPSLIRRLNFAKYLFEQISRENRTFKNMFIC